MKFGMIKTSVFIHDSTFKGYGKSPIFIKKYFFMTENFAKSLIKIVPKWIHYYVYHKNELILYVYPDYLIPFLYFLSDHMNTQ